MRATIAMATLLLASCNSQESGETSLPAEDNASTEAAIEANDAEGETITSDAQPIPALDSQGLRMVIPSGATRLLAFGASRTVVENAIARALGKAGTRSANAECGAGPMEFSKLDGLGLNFQDDRFIGWTLEAPSPLTTIDGMGVGSTRAEIEETRSVTPLEGSTLGSEFSTGGIGGFFDGEGGKVNLLYAGTQCFFR